MRETRRCQMSVPARSLMVATSIVAAMSRRVGQSLPLPTLPRLRGRVGRGRLAVELENTESSQSQRDGLAAGRFQIAHAALDNAVAMIEVAKRDVVIISGGDSGMN